MASETSMFQFPSSGKGHSKTLIKVSRVHRDSGFNSLQAGRGIQRGDLGILRGFHFLVSIPFKREGAFKAAETTMATMATKRFQFPSSGKGHSKRRLRSSVTRQKLFQFPSSGKGHSKMTTARIFTTAMLVVSFNSLQAGRGIQRFTQMNYLRNFATVSIPFKREGAFKEKTKTVRTLRWRGFNSLQAGRGIQRERFEYVLFMMGMMFQFPSSGKGRSKCECGWYQSRKVRFNSLQAGRGVQSQGFQVSDDFVLVSIPFKREGAFKDTDR